MFSFLHGRQQRYSEIVLLAFVIAIAAMLIVPLPTQLLDILLVLNISFSILLLLVGLYVANSSALYTFPTILLLSTLFRLGLNVASSRLILSQGDAGRVIESFGTFLIRGEIVVGIIIFAIVTIVNFIVIAKGAARVSEVAARFFLDALPGRQLVIDNDARAGVISADEARSKRDHLRLESQLYGSMDGAMKFVQGDALAGLFIIAVNILGGVYMGITAGLSFGDAIQSYTVLTVGDGLVTQIPSLLTSICAGIIVTRVSSSETSTLGADLRAQLFSQPITLIVTAMILVVFASLPGIPALPFLLVAVVSAAAGFLLMKKERSLPVGSTSRSDFRRIGSESAEQIKVQGDPGLESITLELDATTLFKLYRPQAQRYANIWSEFVASLHAHIGISLPELSVVPGTLLQAGLYRVQRAGIEVIVGAVQEHGLFVEVSSSQAAALGLSVIREEEHPTFGHKVFWVKDSPAVRAILEAGSIKFCDFFEYICLRLGGFCLRHPEEFLSATDVHSLLRQVEKRHPGLIAEGFGKEFVSVPKLTEVLHELVRQRVSIRDFKGVIEAVASYCSTNRVLIDQESSFEITEVVRHVRRHRKRQMLRGFLGSSRNLHVVSLAPEVEQALEQADFYNRNLPVALEANSIESLLTGLRNVLRPIFEQGVLPVALLCSEEVKDKVLSLIRTVPHSIFVATYEELDPSVHVQHVGVWSAEPR